MGLTDIKCNRYESVNGFKWCYEIPDDYKSNIGLLKKWF